MRRLFRAIFCHDYLSRYAMFGATQASCGRIGGEKPDEIVRSVEVLKIAEHPRVRRTKNASPHIQLFICRNAHLDSQCASGQPRPPGG
jgi:hypothetical protein